MTKSYMKRQSTLFMWETQLKSPMSYYLEPIRMTKCKRTTSQVLGRL